MVMSGMMGGGQMAAWMVGWMVVMGIVSLVVLAAFLFALIAGGRWLWRNGGSGPGTSPPPVSRGGPLT